MNCSFPRSWFLTVVAVLLFAATSLAQTTTITVTAPAPDGAYVGNVYVDPYTGTIGNSTTSVPVICDDWSNNTYLQESWTANVNTIAPLTGTPMYATGTASANQTLYTELAWLGSQLLANSNNPTLQAEYSFAIWQLTYPSYPGTNPDSQTPFAYLSSLGTTDNANNILAAAQMYLCEATGSAGGPACAGYTSSAANYNAAGWEVLTPTGTSCTSAPSTCPTWPAQEFLVYTPEASTIVMLGVELLGILALAFFFRRRALQPVS
jgi:hypothetical protein